MSVEKWKKRYSRLKLKRVKNTPEEVSNSSSLAPVSQEQQIVDNCAMHGKVEEVKTKFLFGEVIKKQLSEK